MHTLIVTLPGDVHAQAVSWALMEKGHEVSILYPADLANSCSWTYDPNTNSLCIFNSGEKGQCLNFGEIDSVWMRRVPTIIPLSGIDDAKERSVAESEMSHYVTGICKAIEIGSFCVNPLEASRVAERKVGQLTLAKKLGFKIPKTIITNSINDIKNFKAKIGGGIIYKPLRAYLWMRDDGNVSTPATTALDDLEILENADVINSPAIYQEEVARLGEIRVVVFGASIFAWDKRPTEDAKFSQVDWRHEHGSNVVHAACTIPNDIADLCREMMKEMNIVYACFDFAIDKNNQYIFFEINPSGQFLYGEMYLPELKLLDAFSDFLISHNPDFNYSSSASSLTMQNFVAEFDHSSFKEIELQQHFGYLSTYHYANSSVKLGL